jgi:hypothetical protein
MSVPPRCDGKTTTEQHASLRLSVTRHFPPVDESIEAEPIRAPKPGKRRPRADQDTINRVALEIAEGAFADGGRKLKKRPALENLLRGEIKAMGLRWDREANLNPAYDALPDHLKMRHGGQTKSQNGEPETSE